MKTPWAKLKKSEQRVLLQGSGTRQIHVQYRNRYGRVRSYHTNLRRCAALISSGRHSEAESDHSREMIEGYMREVACPECHGAPAQAGSRWRSRWAVATIDDLCSNVDRAGRPMAIGALTSCPERERMIGERGPAGDPARVAVPAGWSGSIT